MVCVSVKKQRHTVSRIYSISQCTRRTQIKPPAPQLIASIIGCSSSISQLITAHMTVDFEFIATCVWSDVVERLQRALWHCTSADVPSHQYAFCAIMPSTVAFYKPNLKHIQNPLLDLDNYIQNQRIAIDQCHNGPAIAGLLTTYKNFAQRSTVKSPCVCMASKFKGMGTIELGFGTLDYMVISTTWESLTLSIATMFTSF